MNRFCLAIPLVALLLNPSPSAASPGVVETRLSVMQHPAGDAADLAVAGNGSAACFSADAQTDDAAEVFCAPADPVQQATRVSGLLPAATAATALTLSGDGSFVYYLAPEVDSSRIELFRAPTDASGGSQRMNAPVLASGGNVLEYELLESADVLVYRADADVDQRYELFAVPLSSPGAAIKLNGAITNGAAGVFEFRIDAGAGRVYYRARQQFSDRTELYANTLNGSAPVKLSATLPAGRSTLGMRVVPGGAHVLYTAQTGASAQTELWSVPAAGGAAVRLSQNLIADGNVSIAAIAPDGSRVAWLADASVDLRFGLFSRLVDGSDAGPATIQSAIVEYPPMTLNSLPRIAITPDSQFVLYIDAYTVPALGRLRRAALDGSGGPSTLSGAHDVRNYLLAGDGQRIVARYGASPQNLLRIQVDGSGIAPLTSFSGAVEVSSLPLGTSGRYWAVIADADVDERDVMFQLDLDNDTLTRMSSSDANFGGIDTAAIAANLGGSTDWLYFVDIHTNPMLLSGSRVLRGFSAGEPAAREYARINYQILGGTRRFKELAIDPTTPDRIYFTADREADEQYDAYQAVFMSLVFHDGFE